LNSGKLLHEESPHPHKCGRKKNQYDSCIDQNYYSQQDFAGFGEGWTFVKQPQTKGARNKKQHHEHAFSGEDPREFLLLAFQLIVL
jgi:hypothetical protein